MDRDQRWERTEQAYKAIVKAQAEYTFKDVSQAIKSFTIKGSLMNLSLLALFNPIQKMPILA